MLLSTYNTGDGDTYASTKRFLTASDMIFLQEMLSRDGWPARLRRETGFKFYDGEGRKGENAVQVAWNPRRVNFIEPFSKLLLPRTFVGSGPGGDYTNPKYAVGGIFEDRFSQRNFAAFSLHNVSGQDDNQHRHVAALEWTENLVKFLATFGDMAVLFGGDFNVNFRGFSIEPLNKAGYVNNHMLLGRMPTHGINWTPDQIWIKKADPKDKHPVGKVELQEAGTTRGESDHRRLWVDARFRPGRPG